MAKDVAAPLDERLRTALAPDFRIERPLGEGSVARVFLARDVALDRPVTIKVLKSEHAVSGEARARFEREARAAANIVHANVSNVHRFGVLPGGEPYLVIEYVRGRTLEERIEVEGRLDPAETRHILIDVAHALDAAHRHGVIHRDIRPANILLEEDTGRAIVTDFGIAAVTEIWPHGHDLKITRTGQLLGDPRYVSPEQLRGEHVTETADVYSMALVACEALTGRPPHDDLDIRAATVARIRAAPVPLPDWLTAADPALAALLAKCLAADPTRRPTARAVAARLTHPLDAPLDPGGWLPHWLRAAWRPLARRRIPQWVGAAGAAGAVVIGIASDMTGSFVSDEVFRVVVGTVVAAVGVAAVLAWFHGERGEQRFRVIEVVLLAAIALAWIAGTISALR